MPSWAAMIFNMDQGGDGVNRRGGSTAARRAAGAGGGRSPVQMGSTEPAAGCWAVPCRAVPPCLHRSGHFEASNMTTGLRSAGEALHHEGIEGWGCWLVFCYK